MLLEFLDQNWTFEIVWTIWDFVDENPLVSLYLQLLSTASKQKVETHVTQSIFATARLQQPFWCGYRGGERTQLHLVQSQRIAKKLCQTALDYSLKKLTNKFMLQDRPPSGLYVHWTLMGPRNHLRKGKKYLLRH